MRNLVVVITKEKMKGTILISILVSLSIMSSCHMDDFIEEIQITQDSISEINDVGLIIEMYMMQNSYGSVQGASCYGNFLFQFQDHNENVYIYNLKEKTYVETVSMQPVQSNHCNNVSFSNVFYKEGDEFPLLYVSGSRSGTYNQVQVYRILQNQESFIIDKVQTIILPKANENNHMFWTQVMMDNEENFMYVLSKTQSDGGTYISRFDIPSIDNAEIQLVDDDIMDQFEVPNSVHKQGALVHNGFMYIMYGVPEWGDTNYLRVIDLVNKEDFMKVNISKMGFNQEFEGLALYNDTLIAPTNNAGIFYIRFLSK